MPDVKKEGVPSHLQRGGGENMKAKLTMGWHKYISEKSI